MGLNRVTYSRIIVYILSICISIVSAFSQQAYATGKDSIQHSIIFLGNAGYPKPDKDFLKAFKKVIREKYPSQTVAFLGNNCGQNGMPDKDEKGHKKAEKQLKKVLRSVKKYNGDICFIAGNREWGNGKQDGLEKVKNQEKYIEKYLEDNHCFHPGKGKSGPDILNIGEDIVCIVIDSQWYLHKFKKEFEEKDNEADLFIALQDILKKNKDKHIVILTHHPLYSYGNYGGHFSLKQHVLPFQNDPKNIWVPVPGVFINVFRKILGFKQDLMYPEYRIFIQNLTAVLQSYPNIIYLNAHEHNLHYVRKNTVHHIQSGTAAEGRYHKKNHLCRYLSGQQGFGIIHFYSSGKTVLEFQTFNKKTDKFTQSFSQLLYQLHPPVKPLAMQIHPIFNIDSVTFPASKKYNTGKFKRWAMGENYRDVWAEKVKFPVFHLMEDDGGYSILKKGGGMQTQSLRLQDTLGREYVLRSVDKYVEKAIPKQLLKTFAADLAQDFISSSNPYATLIVSNLAEKAGIYHTNPKFVFLPDDPALGIYRDDFAMYPYILEERPEKSNTSVKSFGTPDDILSTKDVIENITEYQNHIIDESWVLKSRLFDMLIHDWDRHDDQWRWARFNIGDTAIYRPIPRDRDQAFFINEGRVSSFAAQFNQLRKFKGFDKEVKDVPGLIYNARHFDRSFLSHMSKQDWIKAAQLMQSQLSDSIIIQSVKKLPKEIYKHSGREISEKLLARKKHLVDIAEKAYLHLSKIVTIIGTEEDETFEITRNTDSTLVVIILNKKKDILYKRVFHSDETREVRVFGLKGDDTFHVNGNVKNSLKVRIIGGKGDDIIHDNSKVSGAKKLTIVYDTPKSTQLYKGKETRNRISDFSNVNDYNREYFRFNFKIPIVKAGYNVDDGIFLGAGFLWKTNGFRKEPYASYNSVSIEHAFETNASQFLFKSDFRNLYHNLHMNINIKLHTDSYTRNFFGYGNETMKGDHTKDYHRIRMSQIYINPQVYTHFGAKNAIYAGPYYQLLDIKNTPQRYISDLRENTFDSTIFKAFSYSGLIFKFELDTRNQKHLPLYGAYWKTEIKLAHGLSENAGDYLRLSSDYSMFVPLFKAPFKTILALRAGGEMNAGEYEFFDSPSLGTEYNLRGFRRTRYTGDKCVYQSTELRIKLKQFTNYILNGNWGMFVFHDIGRVWYKNEYSEIWHNGYGGGLWLAPFDLTAINLSYQQSKHDKFLFFRFSYLF